MSFWETMPNVQVQADRIWRNNIYSFKILINNAIILMNIMKNNSKNEGPLSGTKSGRESSNRGILRTITI